MRVKSSNNCNPELHKAGAEMGPPTDVQIVTSDANTIAAHSSVLSSASPVLERMIDRARKGWNSDSTIRILGVPSDAVVAFVQLLYSSRMVPLSSPEIEDVLDQHCLQLLAMSHKYRVPSLKRSCEEAVAVQLTPDNAVDVLKLAKLCDAPRLYQQCVQLVAKDFLAVQESDGWKFVQRHDMMLELEILQFLEDRDERKKRWKQQREAQKVYQELSEAMNCLHHIFADGCPEMREPCTRFESCQGLKLLMQHFATCDKKLARGGGGCLRCKRMCQIFRLHSSTCSESKSCRVPFCSHFKTKTQAEKLDKTWRLLAKKVATAKVMSSLANRKRPEEVDQSWAKYMRRK
ncbi:BTB/POZ and TAZ domain-containing protein 2 [Rhynchospora pubera]|uniref:BTB/POZ and TAZ domain-containing protein 2 n=1 Tax=Rhynchospora pubera TaxID=906938 RepID=A0AAV8CNI5_9POAL|nr:BTB/POZ and TAZ domain-containing protein 2 [Rhynchospora pubera]